MNFSDALTKIKTGHKLTRSGWNGTGMFVFLVPGSRFAVNRPPLLGILESGVMVNYNHHIDILGADGSISTWLPSIGDLMSEDWDTIE
jgi:hypothetical protein